MARIIVPEAETILDRIIPVLDRGLVRLVDYMGGDSRIAQAATSLPQYYYAIQDAMANGYHVNVETGEIFGLKGKPLRIACHGKQMYPTVPMVTPNMPRHFYAVPAHKVIAFAIWGERAFAPGIAVRHLNGDRLDIRRVNLALGTYSENERDKSFESRSRVGRIARSHQADPANRKLNLAQVADIQRICRNAPRGTKARLARAYGVSKSLISAITSEV